MRGFGGKKFETWLGAGSYCIVEKFADWRSATILLSRVRRKFRNSLETGKETLSLSEERERGEAKLSQEKETKRIA